MKIYTELSDVHCQLCRSKLCTIIFSQKRLFVIEQTSDYSISWYKSHWILLFSIISFFISFVYNWTFDYSVLLWKFLNITCCYQIWIPPSWWSLPKPRSDASAAKINSSLDQPISSCCIVPADADFFNAKLKLFKYKQTFWTYLFIS